MGPSGGSDFDFNSALTQQRARQDDLKNQISNNKELDDITRDELLKQLNNYPSNGLLTPGPEIDQIQQTYTDALSSQDPLYIARRQVSQARRSAADTPGVKKQTILTQNLTGGFAPTESSVAKTSYNKGSPGGTILT